MASFLDRLAGRSATARPQAKPGQPVVERHQEPARLRKFYGAILKALGKAVEPKPASIPTAQPSPQARPEQQYITGIDSDYFEFLYFERWLPVVSSNVKRIRYFYESRILGIEFIHHGSYYEYPSIGPQTALEFARANSKGRFVWDELRTVNRPYYFVSSADGHIPRRIGWQVLSRKSLKRIVRKLRAQPQVRKKAVQFDFERRFRQRFDPGTR